MATQDDDALIGQARRRWVIATALLKEFHRDHLVIPRALKQRRWEELAAVADLAWTDVDKSLALTDPALYRTLREAITLFHIKGWGALDRQKLNEMAASQEVQAPPSEKA